MSGFQLACAITAMADGLDHCTEKEIQGHQGHSCRARQGDSSSCVDSFGRADSAFLSRPFALPCRSRQEAPARAHTITLRAWGRMEPRSPLARGFESSLDGGPRQAPAIMTLPHTRGRGRLLPWLEGRTVRHIPPPLCLSCLKRLGLPPRTAWQAPLTDVLPGEGNPASWGRVPPRVP